MVSKLHDQESGRNLQKLQAVGRWGFLAQQDPAQEYLPSAEFSAVVDRLRKKKLTAVKVSTELTFFAGAVTSGTGDRSLKKGQHSLR